MDGPDELTASYRNLLTCICTTAPVLNGDVPEELFAPPKDKNKDKAKPPSNDNHRGFHRGYDDCYDRYNRTQGYFPPHGSDSRGSPPFGRGMQNYNDHYYNGFRGNDRNEQPPFKQQKVDIVELAHYHPKIKEAVTVLCGQGHLPRIQDMCKICNVDPDKLFKPGVCAKGTLFRTCFASCPRAHVKITDAEVEAALAKL